MYLRESLGKIVSDIHVNIEMVVMKCAKLTRLACRLILSGLTGCRQESADRPTVAAAPASLTDAEVENLVRRSYQYVALYNINYKFATEPGVEPACRPLLRALA